MKYIALRTIIIAVLLSACGLIQAQTPFARLNELLPAMAAIDSADAKQVEAMGKAQVDWLNYALVQGTAPNQESLRAEINLAMTDALKKDIPVDTKVWLLHVLGWTGTDAQVEEIASFLTNPEKRLVDEAARALATIASPKTVDTLREAKNDAIAPVIEAALSNMVADLTVGTESELPLALPYLPEEKVAEYVGRFDKLSADDQARTLSALTVLGENKYIDLAKKSLKSKNADLKLAAIFAIGKMGTPAEVLSLSILLTDQPEEVKMVLTRYPGKEISALLVDQLKKVQGKDQFSPFAEVISQRGASGALPILFEAANKAKGDERFAILSQAENLAGAGDIADFVALIPQMTDGGQRDRLEQIIARLAQGDSTPVTDMLNAENAAVLLPIIGRIGGNDALSVVKTYLTGNNRAAALRAMCNWPNAQVADDLLELTQANTSDSREKLQALRAFIRVISLPDDQIGISISGADRVKRLREGMKLATRDEERNLILNRAGSVRESDSVNFIMESLDNDSLKEEACRAINSIAHHDYMRRSDKELFNKALDAVIATSKDSGTVETALRYKQAISGK